MSAAQGSTFRACINKDDNAALSQCEGMDGAGAYSQSQIIMFEGEERYSRDLEDHFDRGHLSK
jgi:hypothetical protein